MKERNKMKIDPDRLFEKLAIGLRESSNSLRNIPINLVDRISKDHRTVKMLEDPNDHVAYQRLIDCTFKNEDIYDYLFRQNLAQEGLVAISASTDVYKISSFNAKIQKMSNNRLHVEITEVFSISKVKGLGKIYNDGERIDFTGVQPRQIIDWICKILQCSSENLFDRLDKKDLKSLFSSDYSKYFDKDGLLRSEFSDLDTYDLLESNLDFDAVAREFMPMIISKYWQFDSVKRRWTHNYEYEVDYSDAIVHLDENQLSIKEKVRDRIYSALKESFPFKINFGAIETPLVDAAFEMIALRLRDSDTYQDIKISQDKLDEESFINALEYFSQIELVDYIKDCKMPITLSICSSQEDTDRYKVFCHVMVYADFFEGSVVYTDEELKSVPTEVYMRLLAEDRNLDFEENYDSLKEEVLETCHDSRFLHQTFRSELELDFEDIY